jgi:predicted permease
MALTLVLLVGAGLFVQTLARLYAKDVGFSGSRLLLFSAEPDAVGYSAADAPQVMRDLLQELQNVPDVESVAVANSSVLSGGSPTRNLTIQSDQRIVAQRPVPIMRVGPGFFATLGTPIVTGRDFTDGDTRDHEKTGVRSVIVNESFARRYFGERSPVGHHVGVGNRPDTPTNIEIVGVVGDFSLRFLRDDYEPAHAFFPFGQTGPLAGNGVFYLRVRGQPEFAFASIRAAVAKVDPRLPMASLRTGDDQIDSILRSERMLATLSSSFGALALLLAVVGLYGVMSFVVTQRTQEIGVRLALGATRSHAMWLVIRDALLMIAAGCAIAIPSAWALRTLVESQLFGVRPFDGPTIALASGVLCLAALAAATIPAWRAAAVSPTEALRCE